MQHLNQRSIVRATVFAGTLLASYQAQAVMITVEATGTIYDSYDYNGSFSGSAGNDTFVGRTVTATWTFDTDDVPADYYNGGYSDYAYYQENSNWITGTVTLGGSGSVSEADQGSTTDYSDSDWLILNDGRSGYDQYYIGSYNYDYQWGANYDYDYFYSYAYIVDYIDEIIDGVSADQTFDWTNDDSSDYGYGWFQFYDYDPYSQAWGRYTIDNMTASVVDVPEPETLAMFGLGLVGLGLARRRQLKD